MRGLDNLKGEGVSNLSGLNDVSISSPSNGQTLKYNSTSHKWENASGGSGGASSLTDLDDIDIESLSDGDMLGYNSYLQKWSNIQLSYYNISDKPTINNVEIEGDLSFSDLGMDEYYVDTYTLGETLADYVKKTVDDEDLTIETDSGYNMYLTSDGDMEISCSGSLALNFDTTDGYNIRGDSDGFSFNGAGEGNTILGCNENTFTLNSGAMSVNGESLSINVNGDSGSSFLSASDSGVSITGNNHIILDTNEEHPSMIEIGEDISIGSIGDVIIEAGTSSSSGDQRIILNAMQDEYSGCRKVYIQTSHGQSFGNEDVVAALKDIMRAIGCNHEFNKNNSYNVDDIVFWCDENGCGMFKFVSPHSSGDDWNEYEVTQIDIIDYINGQ